MTTARGSNNALGWCRLVDEERMSGPPAWPAGGWRLERPTATMGALLLIGGGAGFAKARSVPSLVALALGCAAKCCTAEC